MAIDNIIVTTENCSLSPYFAKPGTHALFISLVFHYLLSCRDHGGQKCSLIDISYISYDFKLAWSDAMKTNMVKDSPYKGDTLLIRWLIQRWKVIEPIVA